jgi:hypothetical protein
MTRDKAISIVKKSLFTPTDAMRLVDALADLGLLKLEEPPSPDDLAIKALMDTYHCSHPSAEQYVLAIKAAGLKIVEADK